MPSILGLSQLEVDACSAKALKAVLRGEHYDEVFDREVQKLQYVKLMKLLGETNRPAERGTRGMGAYRRARRFPK